MEPVVDYNTRKRELIDASDATLSPNGKSVQCNICTDRRTGGLIMMHHGYCLNVWITHCKKIQMHIRKMAARHRAIKFGIKAKKRKQHSLRRWWNPKKKKQSRYKKTEDREKQDKSPEQSTDAEALKSEVVSKKVVSTDTNKCAGAYILLKGQFINRTMLYTKYVIPMATLDYEKCTYMGMDAIHILKGAARLGPWFARRVATHGVFPAP